ncbi:MAG: SDR family oxidoreductase [Planctomycetota bacterium]
MSKALIIGAHSAIATAVARRLAARGDTLYLVARDADRLADLAADLTTRGAAEVGFAELDVLDTDRHATAIAGAVEALGTIDLALIAHGTLPDQSACEADAELARRAFDVNATSVISLLTPLAERMAAQGGGTIAVISSVAGDRGRASNYVYGSAKAAVTAFTQGLRQRLAKAGVHVVTVRPGFVDTPMTADFPKGPLWASPETIARGVLRAVDRRQNTVYLPWFWRWIMTVICLVPEPIFKRMKL